MKRLDYPALIIETVDELRNRERSEKEARLRLRVQLLRLLKNQETDSMKAACRICGISPKHGYALWKKYQSKGLDEYLRLEWKPRRAKLSAKQQATLIKRATSGNGFGSQAEALAYLGSELGVAYTQGGVSLLFQRLRIKAKQPRPRNKQASSEEQTAYKKTLPRE
jgi:transposase